MRIVVVDDVVAVGVMAVRAGPSLAHHQGIMLWPIGPAAAGSLKGEGRCGSLKGEGRCGSLKGEGR